ncbi:MAG: hypothetical protein K9L86_01860 [Candidatus Omnitrophica bacterium]|nr:hypothetical protein [Candidatus Omnitrophota bacterium]
MSEKKQLKIPKLNLETLKQNFVIVVAIVMVFVFVIDLFIFSTIRKTNAQIKVLQDKKAKAESASAKIGKFANEKLYLSTENFERKVPYNAIPPVAAMQQAGIIISRVGARGTLIISKKKSEPSSSQGQSSSNEDQDISAVGSKTLKETEFSYKFKSNYENLMKILEELSVAEPLLVIRGFVIKRIDSDAPLGEPIAGTPFFKIPEVTGDERNLEVELILSSFSELSPDGGI